jgi:hypothetical protein
MNAPQRYAVRTLHVVLLLTLEVTRTMMALKPKLVARLITL